MEENFIDPNMRVSFTLHLNGHIQRKCMSDSQVNVLLSRTVRRYVCLAILISYVCRSDVLTFSLCGIERFIDTEPIEMLSFHELRKPYKPKGHARGDS